MLGIGTSIKRIIIFGEDERPFVPGMGGDTDITEIISVFVNPDWLLVMAMK